MASAISHKIQQDVRLARLVRLALAALVTLLASAIVCTQLRGADLGALSELIKGFADLLHTRAAGAMAVAPHEVSLSLCYLGLLLFSAAAVWCGYYLQGFVRVFAGFQLSVIGAVYAWICWLLAGAEGRPVSTALAIVIGVTSGIILKRRDEERRSIEARQFELKLRNKELQDSRIALIRQDEAERRLLAADLHDQVLNDLRTIAKNFDEYTRNQDKEAAAAITLQLKRTMNDIREIMDDLCPVMLEEFGLVAAIEDRLDKAAKNYKLSVRVVSKLDDTTLDKLSPVERQLVYRLIQESVTNVCKHAEAKQVRITLEQDGEELVVAVIDNGKGIDLDKLNNSSRGTVYMRLRAALIGARVSWHAGPDNKGTKVEIRMPIPEPVRPTQESASQTSSS